MTTATPAPMPTNAQLLIAAAPIYAHIHGKMSHAVGSAQMDPTAAACAVAHVRILWAAVLASKAGT